jgi:glutamate synthase (NADPH/NADH) small chain
MPGSRREVAHAEEEGVRFEWLAAPHAFHGQDGAVARVEARRMRLGAADASGRRTPEADASAPFWLPADLVIEALGFEAEDLPLAFGQPALPVTRWGTVKADPLTLETGLPGVFAGGDIVRGASLVVWAMRDGRDAARAIHARLTASAAAAQRKAA